MIGPGMIGPGMIGPAASDRPPPTCSRVQSIFSELQLEAGAFGYADMAKAAALDIHDALDDRQPKTRAVRPVPVGAPEPADQLLRMRCGYTGTIVAYFDRPV